MKVLISIAVLLLISTAAYSAVTIDENGYGFVGKGDVQALFDWNNAQLQENADLIRFRYAGGEESWCWTCERDGGTQTQVRSRTREISGSVAFDGRKNRQGQITGFNLNGWSEGPSYGDWDGPEVGSCPNKWSVIAGPTYSTDGGNEILQVSVDGGTTWVDLPITL